MLSAKTNSMVSCPRFEREKSLLARKVLTIVGKRAARFSACAGMRAFPVAACALVLCICLAAVPCVLHAPCAYADDAPRSTATQAPSKPDTPFTAGSKAVLPPTFSSSGTAGKSSAAKDGVARTGVSDDALSGRATVHASPLPTLPNPTTEEFIDSIGEQARQIASANGLYASVMIAQAILESGSGSSSLSKPPYNNLFGIKGSYKGSSVYLPTQEDDGTGRHYDIVAAFRSYPSTRESLEDYAYLLTVSMGSFYAPAWKANAATYADASDYLQGHYATATTYSASLQGLIVAYDLEQYDHPADANGRAAANGDRAKTMLSAVPLATGGTGPGPADVAGAPDAARDARGAARTQSKKASGMESDADGETGAVIAFAKSPAGQAGAFALCPAAVALACLARRGAVASIALR